MNAKRLEEKNLGQIDLLEKEIKAFNYEVERDEFQGEIILSVIVAEDFHPQRDLIYDDALGTAYTEVDEMITKLNLENCLEEIENYSRDEFLGIEIVFRFYED